MKIDNDQMYNWITKRTNPLAGECFHNCSYCYVKGLKKRFPKLNEKYSGKPRLVPSEFKKKFKKEDVVFVCTCNDLFAKNVPENLIIDIVKYYAQFESTFLFQTKNAYNARRILTQNSIVCLTIESNKHYPKIMGNSPKPNIRANESLSIRQRLFITIEPILDFDLTVFVDLLKYIAPEQINIGSDSGHNNLPEPPKEKILELISELEKFTKVKLKSNLNRIIK